MENLIVEDIKFYQIDEHNEIEIGTGSRIQAGLN